MTSNDAKKRVAIVGCGYVGCALGEALGRAGHDVVGTTATKGRVEEIESTGIAAAVLEHAETDKLHALLADRDVVFLAVAAGRRRGNYREVYLDGAKNLLHAVQGTPVTRIIYTSSTGVYSQDDGCWVDESSPADPATENNSILLQTEQTLLEAIDGRTSSNTSGNRPSIRQSARAEACGSPRTQDNARSFGKSPVTIVRLGAIYGPGRDMGERIRASAGGERDNGDAYINMIHLDDIVGALTKLLDVAHHGVLNLCNDKPLKRRELYDSVIAAAGLPPVRWITGDLPPSLGKRVRNDLIKKALALSLQHPVFL